MDLSFAKAYIESETKKDDVSFVQACSRLAVASFSTTAKVKPEGGCGCCGWTNVREDDYYLYAYTQVEMALGDKATLGDVDKSLKASLCNNCYTRLCEMDQDAKDVKTTMRGFHDRYTCDYQLTVWASSDISEDGCLFPMNMVLMKMAKTLAPGMFKFHSWRTLCHACGSKHHATICCEKLHSALDKSKVCKFCNSPNHATFFCPK
jgi:hypothetical protein